jgi:hypothetical protein
MKYLLAVSFFFLTITAFSQERPRFSDVRSDLPVHYAPGPPDHDRVNTNQAQTGNRVSRVVYAPNPMVGDKYKEYVASRPQVVNTVSVRSTSQRSNVSLVQKTALVTSTTDSRYTQKTSQITGTTDGRYTQHELLQPPANTRLGISAANHLRGLSTGDRKIDTYIVDSSQRYGIDPLLIYAQMNQESSFKLHATSPKGASGLMQLMPATARRMGVDNIYDARQNIEGGVKYMRLLLDMFNGDVDLALAGYNAGEGAVIKNGYRIPPYNETQDYVRRISARYRAIKGAGPGTVMN